MPSENPLFDDREIEFQLYDVHDAAGLTALPAFSEHSRETFDLVLRETRKVARNALFPAYRELDVSPAFENGAIRLHPKMRDLVRQVVGLGLVPATRGADVGGQRLPMTIDCVAQSYLCAANLAPASFVILCRGPGHLIEAFGSDDLKRRFMEPLYRGEWTGTMALTEPHAGSSLADLTTTAKPSGEHYLVRGTKIFISGGDHDIADNIVHLVLARIEGAPPGTKGISLFAIPKKRDDGTANDVAVAGMVHKIGWKALPSLIMSFGEHDDCHGWLVGEPNQGLAYMFQMMNEARIGVGLAATATASVAYRQALEYARTRPQGRPLGARGGPQVPIVEHADVRRMLLRQKAIAEGSMSLVIATARYADVAEHGATPEACERAQMLLDLLTPMTKILPRRKRLRVHRARGADPRRLRLLERVPARGLAARSEAQHAARGHDRHPEPRSPRAKGDGQGRRRAPRARGGNLARDRGEPRARAREDDGPRAEGRDRVVDEARHARNVRRRRRDDAPQRRLPRHDVDARRRLAVAAPVDRGGEEEGDLYEGKRRAARYFIRTEVPHIDHLAALCTSAEDSYASMKEEWF